MLLSSSETVLSVRRGSSLGQQKTYQVKNKNKKFTSSDEVHSQSLSERCLPCASPVSCLITQAIDYYPDYVCPGFIIWFLFFFFLKKRCPISVTVQQQDITKDIPVYILHSESCLTASGLFVTWKKTQPSHTFAIITTLWISAGWVTCLDFEETCTASSPGTWMSPTHQYPSLLLQLCGLAGGEVILVYLRHVFSYDIFKEPKVIWAVSKIRQQFWEMSQCGSWKRHKGPKAHWINGKMCNNLIWWSTGQWDSQKLKPLMHEPCSKDSLDAIKVNWG